MFDTENIVLYGLFVITGVLVITRSSDELAEACNKLMDTNMQLMASLKVTETLETKDVVSLDSAATTPIAEGGRLVSASQHPLHQRQQQLQQLQQQQKQQQQRLEQVSEEPAPQDEPKETRTNEEVNEGEADEDNHAGDEEKEEGQEGDDSKDNAPPVVKDDAPPVVKTVSETVNVVEILNLSETEGEQSMTESLRVEETTLDVGGASESIALSKDNCSPDEGYGPDIASSMSGEAAEDDEPLEDGEKQPDETVQSEETPTEQCEETEENQPQMKTSESGIEIPAIEISPVEEEPSVKIPFEAGHSRSASTVSDIEATSAIAELEQAVQQAFESMTKQAESADPLDDDDEPEETAAASASGDENVVPEDENVAQEKEDADVSKEKIEEDSEEVKDSEKHDEEVEDKPLDDEVEVEDEDLVEDDQEEPEQGGATDDGTNVDEAPLGSKSSSQQASNESLSTDL